MGQFEFLPGNSLSNTIAYHSCQVRAIAKGVCRNALFLAGGFNADQFDVVSVYSFEIYRLKPGQHL